VLCTELSLGCVYLLSILVWIIKTLTQSHIESIKKLGIARVISKLLNVGYSEEELEPLDRSALVELWGKCVAAGEDQPVAGPVASHPMGYDVVLQRQKLQFEMRKFEAQQLAQERSMSSNFVRLNHSV